MIHDNSRIVAWSYRNKENPQICDTSLLKGFEGVIAANNGKSEDQNQSIKSDGFSNSDSGYVDSPSLWRTCEMRYMYQFIWSTFNSKSLAWLRDQSNGNKWYILASGHHFEIKATKWCPSAKMYDLLPLLWPRSRDRSNGKKSQILALGLYFETTATATNGTS